MTLGAMTMVGTLLTLSIVLLCYRTKPTSWASVGVGVLWLVVGIHSAITGYASRWSGLQSVSGGAARIFGALFALVGIIMLVDGFRRRKNPPDDATRRI